MFRSDKHASALHVGVPTKDGQLAEAKEESQSKDTECKQEDEARNHGEETSKNITAKCTEICGKRQRGKSCWKICLANVYVNGKPERKIKDYVVIDEQSNYSLAKSDLFNKLNVNGEKCKYTLQTCAGQNEVEGRRTKGVMVESLHRRKSYSILCVVECNEIPDNMGEIATPQIALTHPRLRPIASKFLRWKRTLTSYYCWEET